MFNLNKMIGSPPKKRKKEMSSFDAIFKSNKQKKIDIEDIFKDKPKTINEQIDRIKSPKQINLKAKSVSKQPRIIIQNHYHGFQQQPPQVQMIRPRKMLSTMETTDSEGYVKDWNQQNNNVYPTSEPLTKQIGAKRSKAILNDFLGE